jgi:hypothetical protein
MKLSGFFTVLVVSLFATQASAQCVRWTYPYHTPPTCNRATGGDGTCYWNSAIDACEAALKELQTQSPGLGALTIHLPMADAANSFDKRCDYTSNVVSGVQFHTVVTAAPVPTAAWCSAEVQGPYSSCPDRYGLSQLILLDENGKVIRRIAGSFYLETRPQGAEFTGGKNGQKQKIRNLNRARNGNTLRSDLAGLYPDESCTQLVDPAVDPNHPCAAEVHHIVPRVEGALSCPCGRSSYKNALLVSRTLNNKLSNAEPPANLLAAVANVSRYACSVSPSALRNRRLPQIADAMEMLVLSDEETRSIQSDVREKLLSFRDLR